jgi:hypothetical protein
MADWAARFVAGKTKVAKMMNADKRTNNPGRTIADISQIEINDKYQSTCNEVDKGKGY